MRIRGLLFFGIGLAMAASVAQAEQASVKGAFGFSFGQVLNLENRERLHDSPGDLRTFAVERPPTPYEALDTYTVQVTEDDRIREIAGAGKLADDRACAAERDFIAGVLTERYTGMARLESQEDLIGRTVLRLGNQRVEIVCVDADLSVRYTDSGVVQAAAAPAPQPQGVQRAEEPQERDTSGL